MNLKKEKLEEYRDMLAESIRTQLRAKPLGVEVPESWIMDLANNQCGVVLNVAMDVAEEQHALDEKLKGMMGW